MDNYSDDNELIEAMKTSNLKGVSLKQIKEKDCYKPSNLVPLFPIGCEDLYRKSKP